MSNRCLDSWEERGGERVSHEEGPQGRGRDPGPGWCVGLGLDSVAFCQRQEERRTGSEAGEVETGVEGDCINNFSFPSATPGENTGWAEEWW